MTDTLELKLDVKGLGPARRDKVIEKFGSVQAAIDAPLEELTAINGVSKTIATRIKKLGKAPAKPAAKKTAVQSRSQRQAAKASRTKPNGNGNGKTKLSLTAGDIRLLAKNRTGSEAEALQKAVADLFDTDQVPAGRFS